MRGLILSVSFIAISGVAFAGEPQKSTNQTQVVASVQKQQPVIASASAPQKMTDRQLEAVVAGSDPNSSWAFVTPGHGVMGCMLPAAAINGFQGPNHGEGSGTVSGALIEYCY